MPEYCKSMSLHASAFCSQIKSVDAQKSSVSVAEIEQQLDAVYRDYLHRGGIDLDLRVRFVDVHKLIGFQAHTELAYVRIHERNVELLFHPFLLQVVAWDAGFVFIYKSWVLLMVILRALETEPLLKGEFLFEAGDNGEFASVSFCSSHADACVILDDEFARTGAYEDFRRDCDAADRPWEQRRPIFFWRGATTGRRLKRASAESGEWSWLQRLNLCHIAMTGPDAAHCDVGITQIVQIEERELVETIHRSGLMKAYVPRAQFGERKFLFDVDGNSNAWSGHFCSLYSGSCVVKVGSYFGYRQWYYDRMSPWRTHAPVDKDFTDLHEVVQWLLAHDREAEAMGQAGRELAESLTVESAVEGSAQSLLSWLSRRR